MCLEKAKKTMDALSIDDLIADLIHLLAAEIGNPPLGKIEKNASNLRMVHAKQELCRPIEQ